MNFEIGLGIIILSIATYIYLGLYKSQGSRGLGAIILLPFAAISIAFGLTVAVLGCWAFIMLGVIILVITITNSKVSAFGITLTKGGAWIGGTFFAAGLAWWWLA